MGVNMAGFCIMDDEACCEASKQEIIRRYYHALNRLAKEEGTSDEVYKINLLMNKAKIDSTMRAGDCALSGAGQGIRRPCGSHGIK